VKAPNPVKAMKMQLRPPARLVASAGALTLAATLGSCGFDYATDRNYIPGAAVNEREASVDVLGAVVVSGQEGSGTFIASFSNNSLVEPNSVDSIAGVGDDTDLEIDFEPVQLKGGQLVNLADADDVHVTGDFESGNFLDLEVTFGDGDSVQLQVPVYPPCSEFEGLDTSATNAPSGGESQDPCAAEATFGGEQGGEVS
jgi:hypothetical protein